VKYLALIYSSDDAWAALPDDERNAVYAEYRAFSEGPKVLAGGELQAASTATTVRVREGDTTVSDGPFAETKEQLGGYFVLDCDSIDEAVELAARIPAARNGVIEVRPGYVDEAEQGEEDAA
jgi:hypothetical protein